MRHALLRSLALGPVSAALLLALAYAGETAAEAGADAAAKDAGLVDAGNARAKIPPDPPALSEKMQWVFDLRWERGEVYLVAIHRIDMGSAHPTPRVMGRFALELYEGPTLLERARFDFPMLGMVEPGDGGFHDPARFEPKLKTRIGVIFPATKRGTRLELWDRSNDRRWPLPWPPTEGLFGVDAGEAREQPREPRDAGPG